MHLDIVNNLNHEQALKNAKGFSMKNKLLIKNKLKGSYTIKVKKDYGIPKHNLKYYIEKIRGL